MRYLLLFTLSLTLVACDSTASSPTDGSIGGHILVGTQPVSSDSAEDEDACVFRDRTFDDDVTIPRDTDCTFSNVQVEGNIQLNRGARLNTTDIDVGGNIQAQAASNLTVADSRVIGDIQFEQGGSVDVRATFIGGNLQLESNDGSLAARNNTIEGDLQANQNRGGPFTFSDNTIDGNLQCQSNNPAPTGSGNVVGGNKEDQCSAL